MGAVPQVESAAELRIGSFKLKIKFSHCVGIKSSKVQSNLYIVCYCKLLLFHLIIFYRATLHFEDKQTT